MEVAEQDCSFWASDNKYDEHQKQKAKHVVHLTWPANTEITVHNTVPHHLCSYKENTRLLNMTTPEPIVNS